MISHWLTENVELNFLKDNFSILIGLENAVHLGWVGYAIPGTLAQYHTMLTVLVTQCDTQVPN